MLQRINAWARLSAQQYLVRVALVAIILLAAYRSPVAGQQILPKFTKGDEVVLAVPIALATAKAAGFAGLSLKWEIETRIQDARVEVRDASTGTWRHDWRLTGFPSARRYTVNKVKTVDRAGARLWEVTLKTPGWNDWHVVAPFDQAEAINSVLAPGSSADSVRAIAYDSLGAAFFTGPLAGFSPEERKLLLTYAHMTANGTRIGSEVYKNVTYLVIEMPGDGSTWNNLRVTRTERIGRILSDDLALLKAFAKVAVDKKLIGGLKLEQPSRHGTAPDYNDVVSDKVYAYVPLDALVKFADADITSQQLVNQSIVLVNSDRIEVNLAAQ